VLRETDGLLRVAQQARDPFAGELRLGIIPTVAPYLLPRVLPKLRKAFPALVVQLVESQTATLQRMLRAGEIEAAVVALPFDLDHTVQAQLYVEPFLLAVAKEHAKARRKSVTLDDLHGEQLLLLEDGHCLRDQALSVCSSSGAVENANFRATSIETLRQMVAANAGVTLMPELATGDDVVRYIPFKGDAPNRVVGLVWRDSSPRGEVLRAIADALTATAIAPPQRRDS
jgi:LysR family hydrogen peroxide-inducible transcriptional activator